MRSPGAQPHPEDPYRLLAELMPEGFALCRVLFDEEGELDDLVFEELNPAFEEHTRVRRGDALGRRLTELVPNVRDTIWLNKLGAVFLTGQAHRFEDYVAPLERWYRGLVYRPQPGYLAIVFADITAAKRAEAELREREERYRTFFQNVAEGLCIFDLVRDETGQVVDGILRDANPEALRVLAATPDRVCGKRASELFGPEVVAPYLEPWARVVAQDRGITFDTHFAWNDRDYLTSAFPIGPDRIVTGTIDISDRVRAERALAESGREARRRATELEAVLEAVPAAVIIARGPAGESIEGNRLGRELVRAARELMCRAAAGEEVRDCEIQVAAEGGEVRHLLGNVTPLRDEQGRPSGAVGAFVDITQRKRSAEHLAAVHNMGEELLRTSSVSEVVETVFRRGLSPLGARTAVLASAEGPAELRLLHRAGGPAEIPCEIEIHAGSPIAETARSGEALWLESPDAIRARCPDCTQRSCPAYAAIPLRSDGRIVGALGIAFAAPRRFDEGDRHFLGALASRCALAVERARAFEEVQRQRQLLDAVFAADPAGIALVGGAPPRVLMANPAYRSIAPTPGGDPVGKTIEEAWPPEVVGMDSRALVEKLIARREEHAGKVSFRPPSGQMRHLSFRVCPLAWDGDQAMVTVFWDNTELEAARAEAARHAAELDAVFTAMGDGLVTYGPHGEVRSINARAMELLGFARELRGLPPSERLARMRVQLPDGTPLPLGSSPPVRALRGETVHGELLCVDSPRGKLWFSVSSSPVRGPDGRIAMAVASITDVTRLHELQERQDDLLRMISHDLRTPLSSLQLQAQILRRGLGEGDPRAHQVDSILVNCGRITAMIRDLVDVARLESGQLELQLRQIDLPSFVRELIGRLAGTLDTDRVRVEVVEPLPAIRADPDRLERIFINLLSNALKYSPGGSKVIVSLERAGDSECISVRDLGMGISPEELPHLFERFFRSKSSAHSAEGLGLGLYTTALLVKAHGGTLSVQTELGKGSAFRVCLPIDAR